MRKKITLKQIAKELEVSISTVSKALKDSEEISKDTKDKIKAFAKMYNYRPNSIALSLKNSQSKNIGVVIPQIVHHFFSSVIKGIEKYANSKGYNLIICVTNESFEREVINVDMLANGSIDGFILSIAEGTEAKNDFNHLQEVLNQGIPLVLFDRNTEQIVCDKVIIDDKKAAYTAIQKFIDNGRKKIALLTMDNNLSVSEKREEGYKQALQDNGLAIDENLILKLNHFDTDIAPLEAFLNMNNVDAVLSVNEIFGVSAMRILQSKGLQIPKDVSIIVFTDGLLSKYANPSITTISQNSHEMGLVAAKMLIDKIEMEIDINSEEIFSTKILKSTIVERESTIN